MKGLRSVIGSRGNGADHVTAVLAGDGKKSFVQLSTQPTTAVAGFDADKVDVGLVRFRLGQKANEETYEPILINYHQARIGEMLKEQTGHKRCPVTAASRGAIIPPRIKTSKDIDMVPFGRRSIRQSAHVPDPMQQVSLVHYVKGVRAN